MVKYGTRPPMVPRHAFCDGDDEKKWSNHALEQLENCPPGSTAMTLPSGSEEMSGIDGPFPEYLKEHNIQGAGVEFGCGTSIHRNLWNGMHYIGIDQNLGMLHGALERWKGRESEKVLSSQWYEAPLGGITNAHPELKEIGDAGQSITVLQHNHYEDGKEMLDQIYKVLKPGAPFFFMEGTYAERWFPAENRVKYGYGDEGPIDPDNLEPLKGQCMFTVKGWENFLAEHGFKVILADENSNYIAIRQ